MQMLASGLELLPDVVWVGPGEPIQISPRSGHFGVNFQRCNLHISDESFQIMFCKSWNLLGMLILTCMPTTSAIEESPTSTSLTAQPS